jgi:hypothetical protein
MSDPKNTNKNDSKTNEVTAGGELSEEDLDAVAGGARGNQKAHKQGRHGFKPAAPGGIVDGPGVGGVMDVVSKFKG